MEQFVFLPKSITNLSELGIVKSALVVYPVICAEANFDERTWIQISEANLSRLTGMNIKSVREGVGSLVETDLLSRKMESEGRRHYYIYKPEFVRRDMIDDYHGDYFSFHRCIITSGVWPNLTLRSKVLYLAIRSQATFDAELYMEIEHGCEKYQANFNFKSEAYRNRLWDVCDIPLAILCRMVGIERTNLKSVLKQLEHFGLVEKYGPTLKVYLKPSLMVRF